MTQTANRAAARSQLRDEFHRGRIRTARSAEAKFGAARAWVLSELTAIRRRGGDPLRLVEPVVIAVAGAIQASRKTDMNEGDGQ